MTEISTLLSLLFAAFIAATLLPIQSELGLSYLIPHNYYSIVLLVMIASLRNTTVVIINWFIGRGERESIMRLGRFHASSN